jgi:hypothetical protein
MQKCAVREEIHAKLNLLGVANQGISCQRDFVEFNPLHENEQLLKQWLRYRGVAFDDSSDIHALAVDQIQLNGRPFAGFDTFDPSTASDEFLQVWLSWFGINAPKTNRAKMVEMTNTLLRLLRSLDDKQNILAKFQRLCTSQRILNQKEKALLQLNLLLQRIESPSEEQLQQKLSLSVEAQPSASAIDWKKWLARSLQASSLAMPLVLYRVQEQKSSRQVTEDFAKEFKAEIPSLVAETAVRSLYKNQLSQAILQDAKQGGVPVHVVSFFNDQVFAGHPELKEAILNLASRSLDIAKRTDLVARLTSLIPFRK